MDPSLHSRSDLYFRLLNDHWSSLHDAVQRLHACQAPKYAVGVFRVSRGTNVLARMLAWLARLPRAGESADVQLVVTARHDGEEWRRSFAGRPIVTFQSARADGLLVERFGMFELRFRLTVVDGALSYQTTRAAFRLGSLSIPVPSWLGPRITAWERPVNNSDQIAVSVEVHLPFIGRLIAYDGLLAPMEADG